MVLDDDVQFDADVDFGFDDDLFGAAFDEDSSASKRILARRFHHQDHAAVLGPDKQSQR